LGEHEAQAYKDPGTPEEQSRRTFLANATLGIGGIIGLTIAIPVVSSLIPESLLSKETGKGTWSPLTADEFKSLDASTNNPVKLAFSFEYTVPRFAVRNPGRISRRPGAARPRPAAAAPGGRQGRGHLGRLQDGATDPPDRRVPLGV